ncbi:SURF1 family protein [Kribbella flavida]|uniref:SURF1 family protein n=1 Tax=Kribbella flavida TaxID=182640 RepID=UPI001ED937E4|nr:SURF1 family protein [Kribbella flavida]
MASTPEPPPARPLWRTILTPRWTGLLVLALAIAAVMSVLGVWQLEVYRSKTAAATAERASIAPVPVESLFSIESGLPAAAVARRVTATGTWAPAADQIFISDRAHEGRKGFWVVSPLLLDSSVRSGTPGAVMVVRGWVPSVDDPAAKAPAGRVSLTGGITASEAQDSSGDAGKGRVLQSLRIPTIVHMVDYRIYDAFVVATSVEQGAGLNGLALVPPPPPPTDHAGLRNVAYGFQWWLFAAFTVWMWGRMMLDAHRAGDPDHQPEDDAAPSGTVSA